MAIQSHRKARLYDANDFARANGFEPAASPGETAARTLFVGALVAEKPPEAFVPSAPPASPAAASEPVAGAAAPKPARRGLFAKLEASVAAGVHAQAEAIPPAPVVSALSAPKAAARHPANTAAENLLRKVGAVMMSDAVQGRNLSEEEKAAEITLGIEAMASAAQAMVRAAGLTDADTARRVAAEIAVELAPGFVRLGGAARVQATAIGAAIGAAVRRIAPEQLAAGVGAGVSESLYGAVARCTGAVAVEAMKFSFLHPVARYVDQVVAEIVDVSLSATDEADLPGTTPAEKGAYTAAAIETNTALYIDRHRALAVEVRKMLETMSVAERTAFEEKGLRLIVIFDEFRQDATAVMRIVSDKTRRARHHLGLDVEAPAFAP